MAQMRMFAISSLLILSVWLVLTSEGKSTPITRESKQLFLVPHQTPSQPSVVFSQPGWNPYLYPVPTADETSTITGRLFGLANLFNGRPSCPTCPTCNTCATCAACAACPAACPATTTVATPTTITIAATQCNTHSPAALTTTNFARCSKVTAAPSGTFTVTFTAAVAAAAAAGSTFPNAFIGIVATCPNTRITLTCGATVAGYAVTTQSQVVANGVTAAAANPTTEVNFMQVVVGQIANPADAASVVCSWEAKP